MSTWWEGQCTRGPHCLGPYISMRSQECSEGKADKSCLVSPLAWHMSSMPLYCRVVLMAQALYTAISVFTVSLVFSKTWVVSVANVDVTFLMYLLISTSQERFTYCGSQVWEWVDNVQLTVVKCDITLLELMKKIISLVVLSAQKQHCDSG